MKLLATIFSFYIFFLAALPTLQTISFSEQTESCCGGSCEKPEQPQKPSNDNQSNQSNDLCNPLASCNACFGFIVAVPQYIPIVREFATIENNYTEISPSQVSLPIWQPPKIS